MRWTMERNIVFNGSRASSTANRLGKQSTPRPIALVPCVSGKGMEYALSPLKTSFAYPSTGVARIFTIVEPGPGVGVGREWTWRDKGVAGEVWRTARCCAMILSNDCLDEGVDR